MSRHPPALARWLLAVTAPAEDRQQISGDALESFVAYARDDPRAARRWYWRQAAGSIVPNLIQRSRRRRRRRPHRSGDSLMRSLWSDLRYALRGLRKNWGFSTVVILTLTFGIGANTLIYSIVDGVVLNPFPFPEPERLVGVGTEWPRLGRELGFWETLSPQEYRDVEEQSQTLEHVVMWDMGYRSVAAGADRPVTLFSGLWFDDAFPTLAMPPTLGRGFSREELERGDAVAVVSHRYWRDHLGSDGNAIGRTLHVEGVPYTLIGVMPPRAMLYAMDLWLPMGASVDRFSRNRRQMQILARVRPGYTLEDVNAELAAIAGRVEQEFGQEFEEYAGWRLRALPWTEVNVRMVKPAAFALLGAVAFVLLIVCVNVASLLLARSSSRRREIAVRTALGAERRRIVQQLLTESVVLAGIGGVIGVAASVVTLRTILAAIPANLPVAIDVSLNYRVMLFTGGISVVAGILFGLVPALQVSRTDVQGTLQAEGGGGTAAGRQRLQRIFVGGEFAVALVLLVLGGLFAHSFVRMQQVDPGFDTSSTLTMRLTLSGARFNQEQRQTFFTQLVERVNELPGVRAAGMGTQYPPIIFARRPFALEGESYADETRLPVAYTTLVTDGFLEALGIPLVRGRTFTPQDTPNSPIVAVINEEAARRFFDDADPVGRRFKIGSAGADDPWVEVIGVVRSVHNRGLEQDPQPEFFANIRQVPGTNQLFLVARTERDPYESLDAIQAQVTALNPNQTVYAVQSLADVFGTLAAPRRIGTLALTVFALFAVSLAAAGIYAVVSYGVSERTKEIGLRVALGADTRAVRRLVVGQAMLPVAIGGIIGLAVVFVIGQRISDLLFQLSGTDPATVGVVTLLLVGVAAAASYLPAVRASRMAPTVALRNE